MGASRACTSCSSSPLGWTMKTTPRTSISARPGLGFGMRSAGMIDVARAVPAVGAVDGPARVDLEHVAGIELVGGFAANLPAAVANDELPLLDCDTGEETQPSFGSADPKVTRR